MTGGERDLDRLLATLGPVLDPATYAFCRLDDRGAPPGIEPLGVFREVEGLTGILEAGAAREAGLTSRFDARRIVLSVHSDLLAVGLLARVTEVLAGAGIACNVISALTHDHLFVPAAQAEAALAALRAVGRDSGIIYAVTVRVDRTVAAEWLEWMRAVHVPDVLGTGCFTGCSVERQLDPPEADDREAFVLRYRAPSEEQLRRYQREFAPALQREHGERYHGRFTASRTVCRTEAECRA